MYLGIDLGTTNVKAIVADRRGTLLAAGSSPVERYATPDGGIEQDIEQIWDACGNAISEATADLPAKQLLSVGVSSQGAAMQPLDARGKPLGRVLSWLDSRGMPFDRRQTALWVQDFFAEHLGHSSSSLTIGQVLRLRAHDPCFLRPPQQLGFVGDVIAGRLCGRRGHDLSSLSIAMLCNPRFGCADREVLRKLGLESSQLPSLLPPTAPCGLLLESTAEKLGLTPGIPVSPAVHDQYAASLGAGAVRAGDVNLGCGTAWVLLANMSECLLPVTTQAFVSPHPVSGLYGQLISLGSGGSVLDWTMRLLGHPRADLHQVDALLDRSPPLSRGLMCWPFLTRGCTPASFSEGGRLSGLALEHEAGDVLRSVLEGLACELGRQFRLLKNAGISMHRISMCGPGTLSRHTSQIIANVLQFPILCMKIPMSAPGEQS